MEDLIKWGIWDKTNNKPYDVFLEESPSTRLSLGWFDLSYQLTQKGIEQISLCNKNFK